jgi:arginine/ornithine N-succinyltransferase beta subunit
MKEMMKEHPVYVALLKKLEENIIGEDINEVTQSI